jgi:hypothetical protein
VNFLAPALLAGAIGIAIPIIIHLIGRRRARVVRFAAMDFLLGSRRKTARRLRLRELVLLAIRVLVCLALPLALAKPFTSCAARGPLVERGPQAAVIIVDDGLASGYQLGDESLLGRAKDQARRILDQLGPEAEIAIVRAARGSEPPGELTRDHIRLRDALGDIGASAHPADLDEALHHAVQLLASTSQTKRTVYVVSALPAHALTPGETTWPADGPALRLVDVRHGAALPNLAVTAVSAEPDGSSGTRGIAVTAEIAYFAGAAAGPAPGADSPLVPGEAPPLPVENLPVSLSIDSTVVAKALVTLRPGEHTSKRFLAALPEGARAADVTVAISPPGGRGELELDDRRHLRVQARDEIRVLLVDGDPHSVRHDDELFYLEAALRPGDRDDSSVTLRKIAVEELAKTELGEIDVIVLANVRALTADRVATVDRWVRGGGGLLVTVGDHVDPDAYERTMRPLLPQSIRSLVDTAFGAGADERAGRALRLTKWEADHPMFALFSKDAPGLREASFTRILVLGPTTAVDDRKVLARYTNGAAALVEGRSGAGRLLLFTSSIDRDWNDLPIHPGYLPLIQQAVRYLARKQVDAGGPDGSILVGGGTTLPVADERRLEIRHPGGERTVFEGDRIANHKLIRFTAAQRAGFYRIHSVDPSGVAQRRAELDFAVNIDAHASDLAAADPTLLPAGGSSSAPTDATSHRRRLELWHGVAVGLLLLLFLESLLMLR